MKGAWTTVIVESNASPIINLVAINQPNILRKLFNEIIISEVVYNEITVISAGQLGSKEVRKLDWIKTQKVSNKALVKALKIDLDQGEAEAIALAAELNSDLLFIDEKMGRTVASRIDLKFVGLLVLLLEAKFKGIIQNIKPVLVDLRTKAGFWIRQQLYSRVLEFTNEN